MSKPASFINGFKSLACKDKLCNFVDYVVNSDAVVVNLRPIPDFFDALLHKHLADVPRPAGGPLFLLLLTLGPPGAQLGRGLVGAGGVGGWMAGGFG